MWIDASAFHAPPSANGGHGKSAGVMVGSHIDKTGVASDVVNTIRIGARNGGAGGGVALDPAGLVLRPPLPTGLVVGIGRAHIELQAPCNTRCRPLLATT